MSKYYLFQEEQEEKNSSEFFQFSDTESLQAKKITQVIGKSLPKIFLDLVFLLNPS
jgi:hypothetical protein